MTADELSRAAPELFRWMKERSMRISEWPASAFHGYLENVRRDRSDRSSFQMAMEILLYATLGQGRPGSHSVQTVEQMWQELHKIVHAHPEIMGVFLLWAEEYTSGAGNDHWYRACYARSVLDFAWAHPLFADCRTKALEPDYPEDLEDMMIQTAWGKDPLPAERIPDNVPTTHWWWWAPERTGPDIQTPPGH